jgi:hypothetical protein
MTPSSINPTLLIAKALPPSGYTWTLTSRLGQILRLAEAQFGERDRSYTILGVEFVESHPQIWYPGNCKHIAIQLGVECLHNNVRACYQLAHESIHLLSPTGGGNATVLEEGLATYFSRQYVHEQFDEDWRAAIASYNEACALVEQLLKLDEQAIKHLREEEAVISRISGELLLKHYPALGEEVAEKLGQPFDRKQ